ncbi:hypothetical protein PAXRUDRAFT_173874, partial [Paxillus rubicundulus Ve08.2h10]
NEPTEPPDEKEEGRWRDSQGTPTVKNVEGVEAKGPRQTDKRGGRGVKGDKLREVEDELGGQSKGNSGQPDGQTSDTGDATSSASRDSKRVEATLLAEDKDSQQRNGRPNVTTDVPGPPTPLPITMPRPTHLTNPPRCRGQLKAAPTKVSKPKCTEYAPCRVVVLTTSQLSQM